MTARTSIAWDHPRACGEHSELGAWKVSGRGSSPRLRGTPARSMRSAARRGIIPALAGNTVAPSAAAVNCGDHPRACGEHVCDIPADAFNRGSSPRLRGTQQQEYFNSLQGGIIPALAGNTFKAPDGIVSSEDHPRACGEHNFVGMAEFAGQGSSPRLRGTLCHVVLLSIVIGIIPALAGNTLLPCRVRRWMRDHPRACGEHLEQLGGAVETSGSSPRLRGTRGTAGW